MNSFKILFQTGLGAAINLTGDIRQNARKNRRTGEAACKVMKSIIKEKNDEMKKHDNRLVSESAKGAEEILKVFKKRIENFDK